MKSPRNKTIDISLDEGEKYLDRCIKVEDKIGIEDLKNKTIIGDSMEVMDFLPEKSIDLLIADPPYNLEKNYHGNRFKPSSEEEYEKYTEGWVKKTIPLLKDKASIYVCCDWRSSLVIEKVLRKYFVIQNRITWQREKGRGARTNWKNSMEDIWFATMSKDYTFNIDDVKMRRQVRAPYKQAGKPKDWVQTSHGNFRDTFPSNFWDDISIPYWSMPENTAHPTQKPEKLIAKLILASSNPGDLVFDPFLGSGTSSVTAKKLNRAYLGIEQNPLYGTWTEKRLEMAESDKKIQGYTDQIFWERNSGDLQKKMMRKTGKEDRNR